MKTPDDIYGNENGNFERVWPEKQVVHLMENLMFQIAALTAERDALRAERETILEAADEWSNYVIEDNAPMTLSKFLQAAIDNERSKA